MNFLARLRAQRRVKLGDQQIAKTQLLFDIRRGDIKLSYHSIIEERLVHARDLRHGLEDLDDSPREVHIEQSKMYHAWAGETLRKVEGLLTWLPDEPEGQVSPHSN